MFRWQGNGAGTKSAWNDGRNWVDELDAPYAQARYPGSLAGAHDEVYFDTALASTALSPAGYDGSALVELQRLVVGPLFDGTIGSASTALKFAIVNLAINASNAGAIYLDLVEPTDGTPSAMISDGQSIYIDGYLRGATHLKGNVTLQATSDTDSLIVGYVDTKEADAALTILAGATCDSLKITGGQVTDYAGIAVDQFAGQYLAKWPASALVNYNGYGGNMSWYSGNINQINNFGADVDASDGPSPRHIVGGRVVNPGTLNLDNGQNNIRMLTHIAVEGGAFLPGLGCQVTQSGNGELLPGIVSTGATPTSASSAWAYLSDYEFAKILAQGTTGADYTLTVQAAADSSGTSSETLTSSAFTVDYESLSEPAGAAAKSLGLWGTKMPSGKRWFKATVTHNGASSDTVGVVIVKRSF